MRPLISEIKSGMIEIFIIAVCGSIVDTVAIPS
jgi:hypothetical protein